MDDNVFKWRLEDEKERKWNEMALIPRLLLLSDVSNSLQLSRFAEFLRSSISLWTPVWQSMQENSLNSINHQSMNFSLILFIDVNAKQLK